MLTHCNFEFSGQSQRLNEKEEELIGRCSDLQLELTVGSDEGTARVRICGDLISVQSSVKKPENTGSRRVLNFMQKFDMDCLYSKKQIMATHHKRTSFHCNLCPTAISEVTCLQCTETTDY